MINLKAWSCNGFLCLRDFVQFKLLICRYTHYSVHSIICFFTASVAFDWTSLKICTFSIFSHNKVFQFSSYQWKTNCIILQIIIKYKISVYINKKWSLKQMNSNTLKLSNRIPKSLPVLFYQTCSVYSTSLFTQLQF